MGVNESSEAEKHSQAHTRVCIGFITGNNVIILTCSVNLCLTCSVTTMVVTIADINHLPHNRLTSSINRLW